MAAELRELTELLTVGTWQGDVASYLMHYGSRCRDCADEDGVCPASGLPCEVSTAKKTIAHVLAAINYGVAQGYLALLPSPGEYAGLIEEAKLAAKDLVAIASLIGASPAFAAAATIDRLADALSSALRERDELLRATVARVETR